MEGLAPAAAAAQVGPTTLSAPPGLTFSYTPADIQGLAEPRNGSGGIQVAGQPPHQLTLGGHSSHLVQAQRQSLPQQQQQQQQQVQTLSSSPRMLTGISSGLSMPAGAKTSKEHSERVGKITVGLALCN